MTSNISIVSPQFCQSSVELEEFFRLYGPSKNRFLYNLGMKKDDSWIKSLELWLDNSRHQITPIKRKRLKHIFAEIRNCYLVPIDEKYAKGSDYQKRFQLIAEDLFPEFCVREKDYEDLKQLWENVRLKIMDSNRTTAMYRGSFDETINFISPHILNTKSAWAFDNYMLSKNNFDNLFDLLSYFNSVCVKSRFEFLNVVLKTRDYSDLPSLIRDLNNLFDNYDFKLTLKIFCLKPNFYKALLHEAPQFHDRYIYTSNSLLQFGGGIIPKEKKVSSYTFSVHSLETKNLFKKNFVDLILNENEKKTQNMLVYEIKKSTKTDIPQD